MAVPAPLCPALSSSAWLRRLSALAALACAAHAAPKWPPVNQAELAETKPTVDPDAGAEIILHEVVMDHSSRLGAEDHHYVRAKIYSERGLHEFVKIELPYEAGKSIREIAARTIKPDGTIVELGPKEVFDREVVKAGERRVKVKSFAPPGVVPGAVVEYRYTEATDSPAYFTSILFQSDLPLRTVTYKLRPPEMPFDVTLRTVSFNRLNTPLKPDRDGYYLFEMSNLPPAKEEPFQPPRINTVSSVIAYITPSEPVAPEKFWSNLATKLHRELESSARVSKAIREAVTRIVAPGDTDDDKLRKIYDFCRTKIVNHDRNTVKATPRERREWERNETASETLKKGQGTSYEINVLFAALVRAAGMDVRLAACNDREWILFDPRIAETFMLNHQVIAVRAGTTWRYFDPGATYLPFGTLSWRNTDTYGLVGDSKGASKLTAIPGEPADATLESRTADLKLDADGTLEGQVTELYSGQLETALKYTLDGKTDGERAKLVRRSMQAHEKLAEVTAVTVANAADPLGSLKISFHLRIPEYADRTGSRLFFQPCVFQRGVPPRFDAATRRTSIFFHYRSSQRDEIHIKLPEGYALEEASAPEDLPMGRMADYKVKILLNRQTKELTYVRTFDLTGLVFPKAAYPAIRSAFEALHKRDNHMLTLKRSDGASTAADSGESAARRDAGATQTEQDSGESAAERDTGATQTEQD